MRMLVPFASGRSNSPWLTRDVFEDFDHLFDSFSRPSQDLQAASYDVEEADDHFLLSFDMPGVKKENIKIEVEGNQLKVSGERRSETKKGVSEGRSVASYQRSFTIPTSVNGEKIEAHYENGVLSIALPKAEMAKPRTIQVQSGETGFFQKLLGGKKEENKLKDVKIS